MTEEERERLTFLIEECSEIIQIASKTLVHGWDSYHPNDPKVTNRVLLEEEISDVETMIAAMGNRGDIADHRPRHIMEEKWAKKVRRGKHQSGPL